MKSKKKLLLILIPVALILIAGAVFGIFYYLPAERTYRNAMKASRELSYEDAYETLKTAVSDLDGKPLFTEKQSELAMVLGDLIIDHTYTSAMDQSGDLPYEEACVILRDAMQAIEGKPQYASRYDALLLQLQTLTDAEIEYAIDAGKTAYALELIRSLSEEKAETFYQMMYDRAAALDEADKPLEAIDLFAALGEYSDASVRAEAIRSRLQFEEASAVFTGNNYDEGIAALLALHTAEGDAAAAALDAERTARRASLREQAQGAFAAGAWHTAWIENGTIHFLGDARFTVPETPVDRVYSGLCSIFGIKDGAVIPFGETFGEAETIASLTDIKDMGIGLNHALFLKGDGTVAGVGSKAFDRLNIAEWTDIVDVAAGAWHSVGLRSDGTVLACGSNLQHQCESSAWSGITAIDAGLWHTVGLCADGTVVACGDNAYGQCDVSDWTEIVSVSCGACCTIGLKADGTVVACGDNAAGQCSVSGWTDVAAIDAGAYHTVGVRMDGSLLSAGQVPNGTLPTVALFDSDWPLDPVSSAAEPSDTVSTAYMEGLDSDVGPWLYLDPSGAVLICIDDSEERKPFRVDMLSTAGALPQGRVTEPDARGDIIRMKTEMVQEQAKNAHAVLAFTGDYIGFTSNRKAVMIRNGIVYYDRAETTTLAILPDGTLGYYEKKEIDANTLLEQGVKDSFSFGPLLVKDGKSVIEKTEPNKIITMRVALGYSDPYHYLAVVSLRDRMNQYSHFMTANTMVTYGAKLAYNFDGGHSTSLVFMGKELSMINFDGTEHHNIRGLSDFVMFLENPSVK